METPKVSAGQGGISVGREAELRARIVGWATERFFERGFVAVTMDEMAQDLGISKKTVYKLFESKEALLRAVMERLIEHVEEGTDEILRQELDFVARLHRLLEFIASQLIRLRQPFLRDMQRNAQPLWLEFDRWRQRRVMAKFSRVVEEGMNQGFLRSDLNKDLVVRMHAVLVQRIMNPETLSELPLTAAQAFEQMMTVFFEGLLSEKVRLEYGPLSREKRSLQ